MKLWRDDVFIPNRIMFCSLCRQPYLRVGTGDGVRKHLYALGNLCARVLDDAGTGNVSAADVIENVHLFQVPCLLSYTAKLIPAMTANALVHVIFDFNQTSVITVTAHDTGTILAPGNLHVLGMTFMISVMLSLLSAVLIVIWNINKMTGTPGESPAQTFWNMRTVLSAIGTVEQRISVFWAILYAIIGCVCCCDASPIYE